MLQTISPDLLLFITTVINESLTSGHVPTVFKKGRMIPILKKPALDLSDISNYRPIPWLLLRSQRVWWTFHLDDGSSPEIPAKLSFWSFQVIPSPAQDLVLSLNNPMISPSATARNLGVTMDNQLSFSSHVANVTHSYELNIFYAHFEVAVIDANANANAKANASGCRQEENANTKKAFIISEHDVKRAVRVKLCEISGEGCITLTSALRSNPSHLRKLDLSKNNLTDSGVKSLSAVLVNPHCKLETLRLKLCDVTDEGCAALTSALRSNPSHLRDLDLSRNKLTDSGVESLSAVLVNPHCKLETLRLCDCGISGEGCAALTSALISNPSHLRDLDLSENKLTDSGVESLSAVLENPHCKLETLRLWYCGISGEGCAALTSALRSNPSHLRELNLSWNNLTDSGVKSLSAVLVNPHCKLETL
ncbi:hypothetical protein QTP86_015841, partial [Hemibagrus guttatus]